MTQEMDLMPVSRIREHRVALDEKVKLFGQMRLYYRFTGDGYGRAAQTSLMLARMWMGKLLGAMGEAHPYPESYVPGSKVVERAVDQAESVPPLNIPAGGMIEMVKMQRLDLRELIEYWGIPLKAYGSTESDVTALEFFCIETVYRHLCEANMWLGMELSAQDALRVEREHQAVIDAGGSPDHTPAPSATKSKEQPVMVTTFSPLPPELSDDAPTGAAV